MFVTLFSIKTDIPGEDSTALKQKTNRKIPDTFLIF